jgi:hypothetical protein
MVGRRSQSLACPTLPSKIARRHLAFCELVFMDDTDEEMQQMQRAGIIWPLSVIF